MNIFISFFCHHSFYEIDFEKYLQKNFYRNYRIITSNNILVLVVHYYSPFCIEIENVHICNEDNRNNYYENHNEETIAC